MAKDVPIFGMDYDLARWSDGSHDESGHIVWHDTLPSNSDWPNIRLVTLDFDPDGQGDYRNYTISPDRPLNVYGTIDEWPEGEPYYDLDDLAGDEMDYYGFDY